MPGPPVDLGARLVARLIDGGVMLGPLVCAGLLASPARQSGEEPNAALVVVGLLLYLGIFLYEWVMLGSSGQTVGKRIMKIKVVRLNGEPIGWGPAAARVYVQTLASVCTCGLMGFIFALSPLFDSSPWKRGWPDKLASSVVVRVPS